MVSDPQLHSYTVFRWLVRGRRWWAVFQREVIYKLRGDQRRSARLHVFSYGSPEKVLFCSLISCREFEWSSCWNHSLNPVTSEINKNRDFFFLEYFLMWKSVISKQASVVRSRTNLQRNHEIDHVTQWLSNIASEDYTLLKCRLTPCCANCVGSHPNIFHLLKANIHAYFSIIFHGLSGRVCNNSFGATCSLSEHSGRFLFGSCTIFLLKCLPQQRHQYNIDKTLVTHLRLRWEVWL